MPFCYEYPRPALTVDAVVVRDGGEELQVLLIKRAGEPFVGMWALPGGFVEQGEGLEAALRREVAEETGLDLRALEPLGTFGAPGRDPRGWVVSAAFLACVPPETPCPQGGSDAGEAAWYLLAAPPPLAFDHATILRLAQGRLSELAAAGRMPDGLFPPRFSLRWCERVLEGVLGDAREACAVAKRMLRRGVLEKLRDARQGRASLYRFAPRR